MCIVLAWLIQSPEWRGKGRKEAENNNCWDKWKELQQNEQGKLKKEKTNSRFSER